MIGLCIKCGTGLKWVNWNIGTKWVKKNCYFRLNQPVETYETKYSRMDQVKFVEDSF